MWQKKCNLTQAVIYNYVELGILVVLNCENFYIIFGHSEGLWRGSSKMDSVRVIYHVDRFTIIMGSYYKKIGISRISILLHVSLYPIGQINLYKAHLTRLENDDVITLWFIVYDVMLLILRKQMITEAKKVKIYIITNIPIK